MRPEFVEYMPEVLAEGVLYISLPFEVAIHLCACGCGNKVVTPIGVGGWTFTNNDGKVTLHPSIGNFQIPCRTHYWIRENLVVWA